MYIALSFSSRAYKRLMICLKLCLAPRKQQFAVQTIKMEVICHRDYFLFCIYVLPKNNDEMF